MSESTVFLRNAKVLQANKNVKVFYFVSIIIFSEVKGCRNIAPGLQMFLLKR